MGKDNFTNRPGWPAASSRPSTYLFTFPFWIYIDRDHPPGARVFAKDGVKLRLYPPFRSAPANYTTMPEIDPEAVPFLKVARGLPPSAPEYFRSFAVIPLLKDDSTGVGALQILQGTWGRSPPRSLPMDSLRIDVLQPARSGHLVEAVLASLITHLRQLSGQWWIGRDMAPLTGYLRHIAPIRDNGEFAAPPEHHALWRTVSGHEARIDNSLWNKAVTRVAHGEAVPIYSELLLDGEYHAAGKDIRRSVLDSAAACEQVKDLTVERLWRAANPSLKFRRSKVISGYNVSLHIEGAIANLSGRSFKSEYPSEAQAVEQMWRARNDIAHGRPAEVDGQPISDKTALEMNRAAIRCVEWLRML